MGVKGPDGEPGRTGWGQSGRVKASRDQLGPVKYSQGQSGSVWCGRSGSVVVGCGQSGPVGVGRVQFGSAGMDLGFSSRLAVLRQNVPSVQERG